jgi:hypothetical protein
MDERPWWQSSRDDEWDEPLPTAAILEPGYGAELPLTSDEAMLGWQQNLPATPGPAGDLAGSL